MDNYRVESRLTIGIILMDQDAGIGAVLSSARAINPNQRWTGLSNILDTFNQQFGNIPWNNGTRYRRDPNEGGSQNRF